MTLTWVHTDPYRRSRELSGVVALSTISFIRELGGITMEFELEDGTFRKVSIEGRREFGLVDFPALAVQKVGTRVIEACETQLPAPNDPLLAEFGASLDRVEVDLLAIMVDSGNIATPDRDRRMGNVVTIERWIDAASRLGAPFARVPTGAPTGAANHDRSAQLDSLDRLADYALEAGVCLTFENRGDDSSDPDWVQATLDAVGRDRIGLTLDIGNFEPMLKAGFARIRGQRLDEDALDFEPVYAAIEQLAPAATVVNAKVFGVLPDGSFSPLDVERALKIVVGSGFAGPITVKYEGDATGESRWRAVQRSVEAAHRAQATRA